MLEFILSIYLFNVPVLQSLSWRVCWRKPLLEPEEALSSARRLPDSYSPSLKLIWDKSLSMPPSVLSMLHRTTTTSVRWRDFENSCQESHSWTSLTGMPTGQDIPSEESLLSHLQSSINQPTYQILVYDFSCVKLGEPSALDLPLINHHHRKFSLH